MTDDNTTLALAAGFGVIAGIRSMAAPAFLSRHLAGQARGGRARATRLLGSRSAATALTLCAAGEMVMDKTPWVPDRTEVPALAVRALSGALSGLVVAQWRGGPRRGAALIGSATAVGASYLAYYLRTKAAERTEAPGFVVGLVEDVLVGAAGWRLVEAVE